MTDGRRHTKRAHSPGVEEPALNEPQQDAPSPVSEDRIDALLPPEMAAKAERIGEAKAALNARTMFVLAVLAGAFIALGANFATVAGTGMTAWPYGVTRVIVGLVFSLGLVLVVVGGAELFTGNNLVVMAWASGRISSRALLRNWGIVYAGNFVGSVGMAVLVVLSGQLAFNGGGVGRTATAIAASKMEHGFLAAVSLGILCNVLVCLAVWLSFSARSTVDRVVVVVPPIAAFVAAGFEHCVANMYFVPLILLADAGLGPTPLESPVDGLTWTAFLVHNLLPVTIGNVIGGALLVGGVYWFVYLRERP